ncbi:hypothetical protein [Pseudomonas sp. TTU2014-080ASC]|uniref:hypothetical protein n=1 Tax=Pseudomonas sp. TTU2014-080ASC TaxID=1729724 RepID=UPI0007185E35|nr:hypothetical protein [Pseudomonas sp. TTU2014-080ASC]KRW62035.1 hypothetical protein AO726_01020 [Pseudomonas sp. TTU2014-080ASC]
MKYVTGEEIKVGDQVRVDAGDLGVVVGIIETNSYSHGYSADDWAYLKTGLLILTKDSGLLHYPELDEEIELIARDI